MKVVTLSQPQSNMHLKTNTKCNESKFHEIYIMSLIIHTNEL